MRGQVEIWVDDELVSSESNLIVDGASELLSDIMTVSPSLSASIYFSGLLNTSNYTVQAASFAKDASAYQFNAHGQNPITLSGLTFSPPRAYVANTSSASSYYPINGLPSYPDPLDRVLQLMPSSVSSLIVTYGQNLNLIPYWSSLSAVSSIGASGALQLGCYPTSTGVTSYLYSQASAFITSSNLSSVTFNKVSSMDWKGFVKRSSVSDLSGLFLSSTANNISSLGEVIYTITIGGTSGGDLSFANLYGGILSMGLWSIDLTKTLQAGNQPPYVFNVLTNPMQYKLFSKKVFNKNLCYILDSGNAGITRYTNLTIRWRLYFV